MFCSGSVADNHDVIGLARGSVELAVGSAHSALIGTAGESRKGGGVNALGDDIDDGDRVRAEAHDLVVPGLKAAVVVPDY